MNERSLRVLEFGKIVEKLKDEAASELGGNAAEGLQPSADLAEVKRRQKETSEARDIIQIEGAIPLTSARDVRLSVEKARIESMLQPLELLEVAETLGAGRRLRIFLLKLAERYPLMAEAARRVGVFEEIERDVGRCIAASGEVMDSASPTLATTRSGIKSTHSRLMERLNSILQSSQLRTAIQDPVITLREDRYCIPVKSDFRSQAPGIIHDVSASGATVFVEPATVVELGNELKRLTIKEREEIEKVLLRLTAIVTAHAEEIIATLQALAEIDFITARGRLSIGYSGVEPDLNDRGQLVMREARHPLLKGEVVPIDVELGRKFTALLITGPNTGGKTVTLKTVGLLTLMAQSGLHIPAAPGAKIAVFDEIFADIGDEQSIEQSLSTFSSHIGNIVESIGGLTGNSLVLLDEIGAGTDPAEGAALAKAILDYLVNTGARTVATTHYGELKEFAFLRDQIENACVDFDPLTLMPTYRLIIGVPGSSNAFAIATRLGMPDGIIEAAKADLYGEGGGSADIIRDIEKAKREALEERRQARRKLIDAENLRRRHEEQIKKIESAKAKARENVKTEAENIIRKYQKRLDSSLEDLRRQKAETDSAKKLEQEVEKTLEELSDRLVEVPPPIEEEPEEYQSLKIGDTVRIVSLQQEGVLLAEGEDGMASVQVGPMKVTVPMSALRARKPDVEASQPARAVRSPADRIDVTIISAETVSPELHIRGQRVDEALVNLDRYVDSAIAGGLIEVRIIHGMGTGALKRVVWQYLKEHSGVESFHIAERNQGGAGATIVELKK